MPARTALLRFMGPLTAMVAVLLICGETVPTSAITTNGSVRGVGPGAVPVSLTPSVTVRNASPTQLGRLAVALNRFTAVGLELPDLEIEFFIDQVDCRGHLGRFDPGTTPWRISICSAADFVYEHELAHAWERATMTDELQHAFMRLRGHTIWSDPEVPWNQRGMEGVAFVIQQGLGGLPLPRVLGSEALSRLAAFELLTGRPDPRLVEWIGAKEIACDNRPTALTRVLPDAAGNSCGSKGGTARPGGDSGFDRPGLG